ncbi:MAG: AMP-binding protein, partial [Spongiibacteraceae bacterium]|nr:AMP-binding protein [Spongiibacteraceae bacterium]
MRAVHQQFEQQAAATPSAVAVAIGEATLDYASLNRQANRIAHTLIARGIAPGDFVGICLDRSLAMVAGILGALKAGAVYVPMDTEYPAERLAYMLADSGVRLLLTDRAQARCLQLAEEQLLCLDDMAALDGAADTNPGLPVGDDQLIYMIYTSGSSGRPKGSLLYHRGFKNLVSWYVEEFGFDADTR